MTKTIRRALTGALLSFIAVTGLMTLPAQASAAPHRYGAIAISTDTGNAASSYGYASPGAARAAAVDRCGAGDCQWVVTMDNNCGAAAQQPRSLRWGWAYAPTRAGASNSARHAAGPGSRTIISACA